MLEPGSKVTIRQNSPKDGNARVVIGHLEDVRLNYDAGCPPWGASSAPGGRQALGLCVIVEEWCDVTDEQVHCQSDKQVHRKPKEEPMHDPDNAFRFETVREPRTKIITLYCRDVDNDELYYTSALVPVEVPRGSEPPVFQEFHEDVFRAMKLATGR